MDENNKKTLVVMATDQETERQLSYSVMRLPHRHIMWPSLQVFFLLSRLLRMAPPSGQEPKSIFLLCMFVLVTKLICTTLNWIYNSSGWRHFAQVGWRRGEELAIARTQEFLKMDSRWTGTHTPASDIPWWSILRARTTPWKVSPYRDISDYYRNSK